MATATGKTRCTICDKEKATFKCDGCLKDYCYNHLSDHKQYLNKQLDEIEINRDHFRQSLTDHEEQSYNDLLIQQIDEWEQNSISKIQRTAEEARQILLNNTTEYIHEIEIKLNMLTDQLRETRQENDFNENNLRQFEEELKRLTKQLAKLSNISIREDSKPFINKISVHMSGLPTFNSNIHHDTTWIQNGYTVAGGNRKGKQLNQLNNPLGICVDNDQTIYIADYGNDRIVEWKFGETNGQVVAGGNGKGNEIDQLNCPTDVILDEESNTLIICDTENRRIMRWPRQNGTHGQTIISKIDCCRLTMDNNGDLYISDYKKHEVRRWKTNDTVGTLVAGGNGKGDGLNQLNGPTNVVVDEDHSVYVSDWYNHRVMKWMEGAKEGIVIAGGQGEGNSLTQLSDPAGLMIDHLGAVYVADRDNHRIMRWPRGATQGTIVVGKNGKGTEENQLNYPFGLSLDQEGNLYVADGGNNRVLRFNIDSS